ncbi:hypothetical protein RIF29_06500 [Crotalaria pallida]|uniref:Uncharacterized protein n=1 Tax=Crotalaria pallida TaxID=3830 RepID=A0AAN9PAC9_CROPI
MFYSTSSYALLAIGTLQLMPPQFLFAPSSLPLVLDLERRAFAKILLGFGNGLGFGGGGLGVVGLGCGDGDGDGCGV